MPEEFRERNGGPEEPDRGHDLLADGTRRELGSVKPQWVNGRLALAFDALPKALKVERAAVREQRVAECF